MPLFTHEDLRGSAIPVSGAGSVGHSGPVSFWDLTQRKIEEALSGGSAALENLILRHHACIYNITLGMTSDYHGL